MLYTVHPFMVWNLYLAATPTVLALALFRRPRRLDVSWCVTFGAWLLFLPNAPYIVTDFVHLSADTQASLWLDGVELSAFAWTGMLLGFVSLYLVHAVLRNRLGEVAGWGAVMGVLALASVGVYLGRVKRWNSWDVLTQPGTKLAELRGHVADPAAITQALSVTAGVTLLLLAAYLVFYVLMGARIEPTVARRTD